MANLAPKLQRPNRPTFLDLSGVATRTRIAPNSSNVPAESAPADDVLLISTKTEVSLLWVNYLMSSIAHIRKQQGRTPFKVRHVTIEESMTSEVEENIGAAHLRIIVVCSVLLEYVKSNQTKAATLSKQLASGEVFAMMLGVDDTHVTESHRKTLPSYPQWKKFVVKDNDADFVNEVMTEAFAVIGSSTAQVARTDQTSFSVLPKKVKMGQSRVIALLNDPLDPEDAVTVVVDKCGEAIDISHVKKRNPYTLQFSIPDRCLEVSMLVGVRILKNGEALGMRQVKCESRLRELDQILRANNNPLEFMCQTLGFNTVDREQLDNWMVHAFQRNLPPHFKLLSPPPGTMSAHRGHTSPEEIPTLLHFAARFGLEKLAWQLLECPGGDEACDLKNVAELTPADLAEQAGHAKLAHVLRGYMQMNEFTNMYTYLKVMSESTSTPTPGNRTPIQDNQDTYSQPRLLTDVYMVPPAARPLPSVPLQPSGITIYSNNSTESPVGDYAIAPAPTPVQVLSQSTNILANSSDIPFQGYMEMHPAVRKTPLTPTLPRGIATENSARPEIVPEIVVEQSREELTSTITPTSSGRLNGLGKPREQAGPQDELLEIINDFKRKVFTINEVEQLVENWKNRNDVQQNFKQKQRQLIEMRDEYERIQKMMKDDMKRPTPFDKVRKFFSKGKKDPKDATNPDETLAAHKFDANTLVGTSNRPVSSLSFQSVSSSSSSGRMSMVSECSGASLGDSGTHSDPDERKRVSTDKDDVSYYGVPPAPRAYPASYSPSQCVTGPINSMPTNGQQRRPPQPPPKPSEADIYYITCPPSGLPIHSFKSNGTAREPETPSSPIAAPVYLDILELAAENPNDYQVNFSNAETLSQPPPGMCIPREYMNHKPVQLSGQKQPVTSGRPGRSNSDNLEYSVNEGNVGSVTSPEAHYADILPVQDTSDLPEYTNVGIMAQVIKDNNSTTYKKIVPAPPVPPRTKT